MIALTLGLLALTACSSSTKGHGNAAGGGGGSTNPGTSTSTSTGTHVASGGGDYCKIIRNTKSAIDQLNKMGSASSSGIKVELIVDAVHKADAAAPSDIKPSWDVFKSKLDGFVAALQSAGVSLDDLSNPSKLQKLSPSQIQALQTASQQLESPDFQAALSKITADVKSRCGVDIGS
jgi:hypothetical protein